MLLNFFRRKNMLPNNWTFPAFVVWISPTFSYDNTGRNREQNVLGLATKEFYVQPVSIVWRVPSDPYFSDALTNNILENERILDSVLGSGEHIFTNLYYCFKTDIQDSPTRHIKTMGVIPRHLTYWLSYLHLVLSLALTIDYLDGWWVMLYLVENDA